MRSTPIYRYLAACMSLRSDLSFTELARRIGVSRTTLWRRLTTFPWLRDKPGHAARPIVESLAIALRDTKDKLLWLAGYNPFVAKDLSPRQLYLLYEITTRIAHLVAERRFTGDANALAALALKELANGRADQTTPNSRPRENRPAG